MKARILLCIGIISVSLISNAQTTNVSISGIRNNSGVLQIAVFENSKQFEDEVPHLIINVDKNDIIEGKKSVRLDLQAGTYALTVLDDEDKSGDMTYKLRVYPLEGIGFSGYELKGLSKPDFDDFDFTIAESDVEVSVTLKYF